MSTVIKLQDIRLSPSQQQMVEDNLELVHYVIHRQMTGCIGKNGIEFEDLVSLGRIGLIRAVYRYDPSNGAKLSSVAVPFIAGEIKHYLRGSDLIKTPRGLETLRVTSLDQTLKDGEGSTLIDLIPDQQKSEEPKIDDNLLRAIETLDRRDRDILVMTQVNGCNNRITAEWLEVSPVTVAHRLEVVISKVKAILSEPKRKLARVKRGRNALPFVFEGVVDYPSKHRCVVCNSIFGLRTTRTSQLPQTCSSLCGANAAIEKTPSRSPAWTKQELSFCDELVGKRNLEDIYQALLVYNEAHGLPFRTKDSVKVKLTRLYKSLKVVEGDLSAAELARQLGIPFDRVRIWLKSGLKSTKTSAGIHKITREDLTSFARTDYHRFYAIDIDKLSALIDDRKVLKKCQTALPHINRIEVVRTDNNKKYRSLRSAAKAVGISKGGILSSGWIRPVEYITDVRTKENPIDLQHLKTERKLLDPKVKHRKRWKFVSPEGVEFETNNLNLFAKTHGLTRSLLSLVWKGEKQSHAGWRRAGELES